MPGTCSARDWMIRDGMIETGPEQVGDGLSGLGGDPGFELFEIVSHGLALLAGVNPAHSLELEPEPAAGKMNAEDVENGCPGEDGQLGPDGQKSLCLAQQPAGPGIGSLPGDVATEVERQAVAQSCPGADQELDRVRRRQVAAQGHLGLGIRALGAIEPARELARDMPGRWTRARTGSRLRNSQCSPAM